MPLVFDVLGKAMDFRAGQKKHNLKRCDCFDEDFAISAKQQQRIPHPIVGA